MTAAATGRSGAGSTAGPRGLVRYAMPLLAGAIVLAALRAAGRRRRTWQEMGRYHDRTSTGTATLDLDRTRTYWLLRDPAALARALDPEAIVEVIDGTRSRWRLTWPAGRHRPVDVLVEVIGDVPELLVAWRVPDGPLPHEGHVDFADLTGADGGPDGRTAAQISLSYRWSPERAERVGLPDDTVDRMLRAVLDRLEQTAGR